MKLYHASKYKFDVIERRQATMVEGNEVPAGELQNKIYFTPDLGFAIAMAAGPDGMTSLRDGAISFEHYDQFDAERPVYVYEVDSESIAPELLERVDDEQFAVDMDEVVPSEMKEYKAGEVFKYYSLVEWKHPSEHNNEIKFS